MLLRAWLPRAALAGAVFFVVGGVAAASAPGNRSTPEASATRASAPQGRADAVTCPDTEPPVPSATGLLPADLFRARAQAKAAAAAPGSAAGMVPEDARSDAGKARAGYDDPRPPYSWAGSFRSCAVTFQSQRTGARLYGVVFFPPNIADSSGRHPGIVIGPGSGQGVQANYQWLARYLAAHGYVALTVDPQGVGHSETTALQGAGRPGVRGVPWQRLSNYIDALRSGLDFLQSKASPVRPWTRQRGFGLAGHSMSARAASTLQGTDYRVGAIVAMDNLSSNREGDKGTMTGGAPTGALAGGEVSLRNHPNVARVPALALASDEAPFVRPFDTSANLKKAGYEHWRAAGRRTMVLVFRNTKHSVFARKPGQRKPLQQVFASYALAWFDWNLRHRSRARALLAKKIAGFRRADFLSTTYRSAVFFPRLGIDCPDVLGGICSGLARFEHSGQTGRR